MFTIGYSGMQPEDLRSIVDRLGAQLLDVRSGPRSSIPGFSGQQLQALLGKRYKHRPDLGGRIRIQPEALASLRPLYLSRRRHAVLMCAEAHPADCHRHRTICAHYPRALHIVGGRFVVAAHAISRQIRVGMRPRRREVQALPGSPA